MASEANRMADRAPLGHVVIGPTGMFTAWVFDVTRRLASARPARSVRVVDKSDGIADLALSRPIYLCNFPSVEIIDAIESGDLAVLFVVEDPLVVAAEQQAVGVSRLDAVRLQCASAVANLVIGRSGLARPIRRTPTRRVDELIRTVGQSLDLPVSEDDIVRLLEQLGYHSEQTLGSVLGPLTPHSVATVGGIDLPRLATFVLDPLAAMAFGPPARPVVWPTEVFFSGDHPDNPAPEVADVTGPARVLYYGPYFQLPPARYRVEVILAFSKHIEDVPFSLEVHGSYCLARVRIEPRAEGGYRGEFHLNHRVGTDPLEIRLRIEQGAIEGQMSLAELRLFVDQRTP